ncbi:MAG: glycosyltransferase family 2 protein [Sumerlaeia bacterium]
MDAAEPIPAAEEPVSDPAPKRRTAAPAISIVVPAYNEEERLPATIAAIRSYLNGQPWSWELLVVDDGSSDGTAAAAREALAGDDRCALLRNPKNRGKGASIKRGMLAARGHLRLFTDADNSTPIEELDRLLARRKKTDAGVLVASRALAESQLEVRQPFYREAMGRTFNLLVQALAVPGVRDTQCGFKLFTAEAAEAVFPRQTMSGFSFDVEILFLARKYGFRIEEVPVRWINSPASRVSPIRDSAKMFLDVLRIRTRRYQPMDGKSVSRREA